MTSEQQEAAQLLDAEGGEPLETAAPVPEAAGTPAGAVAPDPGADLAADLATTRAAVGALTEDLQRLQAEYVNYKRRVDRDRDLVRQNATLSVLAGLLPVLDDLDRAREHGELEGGFKAVADSLGRIVAGHGLVRFGAPGDEFDPRVHEALMHAHSADVTTTTCQSIISAGYRVGERVVRPAQVTVVDPAPPESGPESAPESGRESSEAAQDQSGTGDTGASTETSAD